MRALFEHRGMLSMALGIACGAIVFTKFPFPAENPFLQMGLGEFLRAMGGGRIILP